jgi:hypothetical protein
LPRLRRGGILLLQAVGRSLPVVGMTYWLFAKASKLNITLLTKITKLYNAIMLRLFTAILSAMLFLISELLFS